MDKLRPGLQPRRLAMLVRAAIERCRLDLSGCVVLTEAATGPYIVTPVIAALAGAAHVYALARCTSYGTVEEVVSQTFPLAKLLGVTERITVTAHKSRAMVAHADIITNSAHLRPIDAEMISWMKSTAVVPLMYETWELRPEDVDLAACQARGIAVGGTNERHPAVDVFSFLGVLAIRLLQDAGVAVYRSHILLLCDNSFDSFITRGLIGAGATVDTVAHLSDAPFTDYDVVLVALQPRFAPVLDEADARLIASRMPGTIVAQFWGDIDRTALSACGVPFWPCEAPAAGHMGILLSAIGPEPVVRLQAGGLKVGEILARRRAAPHPDLAFVQPVGQGPHLEKVLEQGASAVRPGQRDILVTRSGG